MSAKVREMALTFILIALAITTIGVLRWVTGRVSHNGSLGSVSQQWLSEYRQDHGW